MATEWIPIPPNLPDPPDFPEDSHYFIDDLVRLKVIEKRTRGETIEEIRFTDDFVRYYLSDEVKAIALLALKDYENRNKGIAQMEDSGIDKELRVTTMIMNNAIYHYLRTQRIIEDVEDIDKRKLFRLATYAGTFMDLTPYLRNVHRLRETNDHR